MKPILTDILCTQCGLCCDGSLFADVELAGRTEASGLEVMGLEIEEDDDGAAELLLQPCRALQGKRCGIYPHRPECCRTFECRLLQNVRSGAVDVIQAREKIAVALQRIERIKELIVQLRPGNEHLPLKERCAEALVFSEGAASNPEIARQRDELEAAMIAVENLIQETFLAARFGPRKKTNSRPTR